jgi:hypothetical protein
MILEYVSFPIFIISFAIGLFFVYILGPEKKIVYIYPNPNNIKDFVVKDKTNSCFQYTAEEVSCPVNPLLIKQTPIQD